MHDDARKFAGHLTDLGTGRPCGDRELAHAAVLADSTNSGPTKMERVVAAFRARGEEVPEEYLRHLSPLEWEHIILTGVYRWNLGDPEAVDADGFRPLRKLTSPSSISRATSIRQTPPS